MDDYSGTWPAVPATAPPPHGAPGEEPARKACKRWTPDRGVARERRAMNERPLSDTDTALRQRITELSVHIPCGYLRGPIHGRWQSCPDEDSPERWEGCDVSRAKELCIVCARGTAGGVSRWSWLACEDCRSINNALARIWGVRPLALGRHSLMNGIGVRGGASRLERDEQAERVVEFVKNIGHLWNWRLREVRRLAADLDPRADITLSAWQEQWPPGRHASADAFSRLLDRDLPLRPPR